MRRSIVFALSVAVTVGVLAVNPQAAVAGSGVTRSPLSAAECALNVEATGRPSSEVCFATTVMVSGSGPKAMACYVPPGYTDCGQVGVRTESLFFGIPWAVTTNAGGRSR